MVRAGYGRVVNVTSSYGSLALIDSGRHPAYRISKTALNALTTLPEGGETTGGLFAGREPLPW